MSGVNGDKSRFNRERKQKLARRKRSRAMLEKIEAGRVKNATSSSKPKAVSA